MTNEMRGFYGGVVAALIILKQAGQDGLAAEIVQACGRKQLVAWCKADQDHEMAKYIRTIR